MKQQVTPAFVSYADEEPISRTSPAAAQGCKKGTLRLYYPRVPPALGYSPAFQIKTEPDRRFLRLPLRLGVSQRNQSEPLTLSHNSSDMGKYRLRGHVTAAVLFLLILSGPPRMRIRDPEAS